MTRNKSVEGKVAVVTGAGRGIGRDVALLLAAQGAKVVVNDVGGSVHGEGTDVGPADGVVNEIRAAGGEAVVSTDSVADWNSAHRIIATALDHFGRIDIVVNNAGILRDRLIFKMSEQDWRDVIDVHLHGSFFVSRAAAEHFKAQNSGAYVHMSSTSGLLGNTGQANYGAAKAGIAGLSRALAFDMQRYNVRSNAIAPFAWSRMGGAIKADTPERQAFLDKAAVALTPAKIAPMIVYLASDLAKDVTGQIFALRGNEIFLMSQPRPVRGMHSAEGWTPQTIAERVGPAMKPNFIPLENSGTVFCWDPI
ncbi:MAG: SDR family oxidoreductase [Sulfuricaulis sp.]|nr:SDR family oxidoreductase [Sulfuricaulis sp.]